MSYNKISHVIFDLDGLLLDTETIYTRIFKEMAKRFGREFTLELKCKQMGKSMQESASIFINELDIEMTIDEYCTEVLQHIQTQMPEAQLMPGVEKLIFYLKDKKIPMAIATGSSYDEYIIKTKKHAQLFSCFTNVVCTTDNSEVKRGKPYPDVFLLALSKFQATPNSQNVLVFEDAPNGVAAALSADMQVVWIPSPELFSQIQNNPKKFPTPTVILKSLEEFNPMEFNM